MNILMIGAHQDDAEFCAGGIAALYRRAGHRVKFVACCNGNGGHHEMTPEETSARRAEESKAVARLLDIEYEVWSDVDDCSLMPTLENRRRMIRLIREYNPDIVFTHRTNDYHADHRAAAQLVQDASYLLIVPHECPEVPALRKMPVILFYEDRFTEPPFKASVVINIDSVIDKKFAIADTNVSQVYEWLPYSKLQPMPPPAEDHEGRLAWLKGMEITEKTTDKEVLAAGSGYGPRFAKPAAIYRKLLIKRYGRKIGKKVRFAEAFGVSEYGSPLSESAKYELFPF